MENISSRKKELVYIALKLFSLNGYDRTSMNDIAKQAGIKKATLYSHFKNKEEVFQIITDIALKNNLEKKLSVIDSTKQFDSIKRLEIICYKLIEYFTSCDSKVECWMKYYEYSPESMKIKILEKAKKYQRIYEEKLEELVEEGILKKEIKKENSKDIILTFTYLFSGFLSSHDRYKNNINMNDIKKSLKIFFNGIKA